MGQSPRGGNQNRKSSDLSVSRNPCFKPEKLFRAGTIQASIWRDEHLDNGRVVVRHNVKFQKRYLGRKTQRKRYTTCFLPDDLPRLRLVSERAFEYLVLRTPDEGPASSAKAS